MKKCQPRMSLIAPCRTVISQAGTRESKGDNLPQRRTNVGKKYKNPREKPTERKTGLDGGTEAPCVTLLHLRSRLVAPPHRNSTAPRHLPPCRCPCPASQRGRKIELQKTRNAKAQPNHPTTNPNIVDLGTVLPAARINTGGALRGFEHERKKGRHHLVSIVDSDE